MGRPSGYPTGLAIFAVASLLVCEPTSRPAFAQGKLEAHYSASIAGLPIGQGTWLLDIGETQYTATASGKVSGIMRLIGNGEGSTTGQGTLHQGHCIASRFTAHVVTNNDAYSTRLTVSAGNVKEVVAEPPVETGGDRVPITEAHRHGISDPMLAALINVAGSGDVVAPEACHHKLAIFDGRQRFDVELSYKRIEQVNAKGYQGPVAVCAARYQPISGHRPDRYAIKYLQESRDIEVALAPIAGTRILVPFRISVPTMFGTGVLQATEFVTVAEARQAPATTARDHHAELSSAPKPEPASR